MEAIDSGIILKVINLLAILFVYIVIYNIGMFIPCKIFGIKVTQFFVFYNPWFSIFHFKLGHTLFGMGWIPLGGYVKIDGLVNANTLDDSERQVSWFFVNKPVWQQLTVVFGGPLLSLILGVLLFQFIAGYNFGSYLTTLLETLPFVIITIPLLSRTIGKSRTRVISYNRIRYAAALYALFIYLLILILFYFVLNEAIQINDYVSAFTENRQTNLFEISGFERVGLLGVLLGFFNLIPYPESNGHKVVEIIFFSFTGRSMFEKEINLVQILEVVLLLLFLGIYLLN